MYVCPQFKPFDAHTHVCSHPVCSPFSPEQLLVGQGVRSGSSFSSEEEIIKT
jgi:hypothetical protein